MSICVRSASDSNAARCILAIDSRVPYACPVTATLDDMSRQYHLGEAVASSARLDIDQVGRAKCRTQSYLGTIAHTPADRTVSFQSI